MADALSRLPGPELLAIALSVKHGTLLDDIKDRWDHDPQLKDRIEQLKKGLPFEFVWKNGLLMQRGKLVVGKTEGVR